MQKKKATFRQTKVQKMTSSATVESRDAVRLRLTFNNRAKSQRFRYLAGLSVEMILGRDFLADTSMLRDISAGGYRLGGISRGSCRSMHQTERTAHTR